MSVSEPAAVSAATYDKRFGLFGAVAAGVWLIFLTPALQRAWQERSTWVGWVGLAALLGFGALYVTVFQWARPMRRSGALWRSVQPASLVWLALLVVLAAVMVLTLQYDGLGAAVYLAVAAVTLLPQRWSIPTALVLAVGAEAMARLLPGWAGADGIGLSVALATFAIWGMWQAMRRSMDLARAREENAQLLLGQERARMSRDLHDLLGHSLTVIAVKAELAERLLDVSPDRARAEIADIQRLTRDALSDMRRTVEGYRGVSLPGEIIRARSALEAAGIDAQLPGSTDGVPSELREVFAWTVREGVTNVVRHSAARHCTITLAEDRVSVSDDGRGPVGDDGPGRLDPGRVTGGGGHGLAGLRERAAAVGARVVTEAPAVGGFTLTVLVPAGAGTAAAPAHTDLTSGAGVGGARRTPGS
ncbi:MAG: histidine kinase [Dermatophilaceae bacterium]